jgi:hypothetical protein
MFEHVPIRLSHHNTAKFDPSLLPENIRSFYHTTIKHNTFDRMIRVLHENFQMGLLGGTDGIGCVIDGLPGVGKTFGLETFIGEIYALEHYRPTKELIKLPILKIRVPGRPTVNRVAEKLLYNGVHISPSSRKTDSILMKLYRMIEYQQVRMIIFDEFQHLLRRYAQVSTNDVVTFMKVLIDDLGLSVVFSGSPEGIDYLKQFPELEQRVCTERVTLTPFNVATTENNHDFIAYIKSIDEKLVELGFSIIPLSHPDMLVRILFATRGIPRFISRLILKVLIRNQNSTFISKKDIGIVYQTMCIRDHLGKFDPFEAKLGIVEEKYLAYIKSLNKKPKKPAAKPGTREGESS